MRGLGSEAGMKIKRIAIVLEPREGVEGGKVCLEVVVTRASGQVQRWRDEVEADDFVSDFDWMMERATMMLKCEIRKQTGVMIEGSGGWR